MSAATLSSANVPVCQYPDCRRLAWQDPSGLFTEFCGTKHRDALRMQNGPQLCKNCQSRPVRIEGNRVHDFCGLSCYNAFQSAVTNILGDLRGLPSSTPRLCQLYGCEKPTYIGPDRIPSDYCSNAHRLDAIRDGIAEVCLLCSQWPKARVNGTLSDFCSRRCSEDAVKSAPLILALNSNMASYNEVSTLFNSDWTHAMSSPTIVKIWRIYCDKDRVDEFSRIKLAVERRIKVPGGNCKRTWYGAFRACTVGNSDGQSQLCNEPSCSVCHIMKTSFRRSASEGEPQATSESRQQETGICSYTASSTANSHVDEDARPTYRAMLFSDVIVGKTLEVEIGGEAPTELPDDHDSVVVQLGEENGNSDYKAIVYDERAILPHFLVIYDAQV
ncbi:hypothetical protein C8Q72DRAFT_820566 [Fomitopsis betulina]|nr:hypothetical protein C8Q72DRAFT_820566 [Fomitopsis betulina]